MAPGIVDIETIRVLVGDARLRTLPEVAECFDISHSTVSGSWRKDRVPMPGVPGDFRVPEILAWLLDRDSGRSNRRRAFNAYNGDDERGKEMREIEIETARTTLQLRQAKVAAVCGEFVPLDVTISVVNTILSVLRDRICKVPTDVRPMLPQRQAAIIAGEIERLCRHALQAAHDDCNDVDRFKQFVESYQQHGQHQPAER